VKKDFLWYSAHHSIKIFTISSLVFPIFFLKC